MHIQRGLPMKEIQRILSLMRRALDDYDMIKDGDVADSFGISMRRYPFVTMAEALFVLSYYSFKFIITCILIFDVFFHILLFIWMLFKITREP